MANSNFVDNEFQKQRWALLAHSKAISALARAQSQTELLSGVCEAITSQMPYVLAWVGEAMHDAHQSIQILASDGTATNYLKDIVISWSDATDAGKGPTGTCIRTRVPCVVDDINTAPDFTFWRDRALQAGIHACIAVPILEDASQPIRVLAVYSSTPKLFNETEVQLFLNFAKEISFGLNALAKRQQLELEIEERNRAQEQLTSALRAMIEAMTKTMEWRDPYTSGHQKRVAHIAAAIASALGLSQTETEAIFLAGLVHDIGKIAVPAEILTKPTHLTGLEMQMVQTHVEAGYQILKDIPFPWPIAEMVHQHHERLDGSGYPLQLKGDQIKTGARVMAVADTIEAMSTHRPYRPALGLQAALDALNAEAGTRLDADVVKAALSLMDDRGTLEKLIAG
jgi:putative nucleotidyltransferase with HDIG domain